MLRLLAMWRPMMHGMVHDVVMPAVVHNPVVHGMTHLRIGKTGQPEEHGENH